MVDESARLLPASYNNNNVTTTLPKNSHWNIVKKAVIEEHKYASTLPTNSPWNIVTEAIHEEKEVRKFSDEGRNSMIYMGELKGLQKPILKWYRGLVIRQRSHSNLASNYYHRDLVLNTLSVALTAITASAIFTSLSPSAVSSDNSDIANTTNITNDTIHYNSQIPMSGTNALALAAGIISAFNTVLQAVMRTLQYAVRYEQHYTAYKQFTKLRFKLETLIGEKPKYGDHSAKHIDKDLLDAWIVKYEDLLECSPIIPQRVFQHVKRESDAKGILKWTKDPLSPEEEATATAAAAEKAQEKEVTKRIFFPGVAKFGRPSFF